MDLPAGPAGWSCLLSLLAGLLAGIVPALCPVSLRLQDRTRSLLWAGVGRFIFLKELQLLWSLLLVGGW